jgi:hypothetical protein
VRDFCPGEARAESSAGFWDFWDFRDFLGFSGAGIRIFFRRASRAEIRLIVQVLYRYNYTSHVPIAKPVRKDME